MPRDLPTGLIALLKSGFAETHSTLAISLVSPGAGRSIKQTIYLATAAEGGSGAIGGGVQTPGTPITIPNAGFETPVVPSYQYNPPGASWTWSTGGIIAGGAFGGPPAASGGQLGFVQQTGAMWQALSGFIGGTTYDIKFKAARQFAGDLPDFDVLMDSTNLGRFAPTSTAWTQYSIPFTAGTSSYTLAFQGVNTAGMTISVMLDDIQIVPATGGITRPPGGRGTEYQPRLRQTGPVAMSLTRSADRVDVVIENIDRLAGNQFVTTQDQLYGSFAEFGRLWRDLRNPANVYQVTLLTGQIVAARASETEVQLTLMSDIYSSGAIAGQILYSRSCPWTFKDAATCAYVGPLATCNKLLTDPDGCSGRANEFHFGGFPYIKSEDTISDAAGIQANLQYQTILTPASASREELEAGARSTTAILQRHNLLLQGFTITDDAANDATKIVAGGVGGANYQTLKENDGYSYARTLPPQPTLNFLNAFKLTDDPGNLETDISTYGVPTGLLNVRTDKDASGAIDVANVVSFNIAGIVTVDATLNLQPRMGILVEGAGIGGADFLGTIGSVSADGKTYVLTASFPTAPPSGARVQADDTVAVQNWINAKGDLAFPPGYYRLTSSIIVPTTSEGFSIIVHGSGWDLSQFVFQHGGDGFVPTLPDLKVDSLVFKDLSIVTGTKWAGPTIDPNNHGYGVRMTAPGYLGVYNNFVLERCRVLGWGAFGIWSDNMEVSWINNCIFRENRFGHIAFVAPDQSETAKLPNANVLRSNAFDQAFGGGDADRPATGSMTRPPTSTPTPAQTDAARAISIGGLTLTAADRGRAVIVHGAGTNNSNLYSFIDVVLTGSTAKLAHAAQTTVSGAAVEVLSSSIASIFLNRAHDTVIDGGTIQGNFTTALPSTLCNAIRADECFNLRIVGVHEEDAGGNGGSAVRLANCIAVNIENWGGTSAGPGLTNAHNADFQIINTHGVSVRNSFFNDRPQFVIDDTSSEIQIDDSWIVGYNNLWQADNSWDRLRIGSGVRTAQTAETRTAQLAGNEYSYDGFFGRDLILNGRFLDGSDGFESWTKSTTWISRTANSPYQGGTFINVNATGIADNGGFPSTVLEQVVAIPDDVGPGLFILGFNWNLDFQGGTEQTGRFLEVRLHPSSGIDEAIQWSTRPYPVVQDTWQVGHVRCFLGTGTGRTIAIRINVTPGPNNVSMHFANFRLAAGKHIAGSWERGISDFGGRMRAPLEFAPITNPPYPPPVTGSPYLSLVNIAGVLNLGKNGAYTPLGTTGGPGTILGPANYYALFKDPLGDSLDYGALKQETGTVHVLNSILKIDQQRALDSVYTSSGLAARLAIVDSNDVCYFGPEFAASGAQGGANVTIRAAHGDLSSLQIAGAERRMTFNVPRALAGITGQKPTFFLGISDLSLDGLRIQPLPNPPELYLGYMLSCFLSDAAPDALFAVDQKGDIVRINNKTYAWPASYGAAGSVLTLQNATSGALVWGAASSGGHTIADEGVPLATQRTILNFVGAGVTASDDVAGTRTNVRIETASVTQEGAVSTSASGAQHFSGAKFFHNATTIYEAVGVALVLQYTGSDIAAHIQDWWISGSTPIAYIDAQPILRLGYPGAGVGRAGYLELCCDATINTVKLACGISASQSQIIYFPEARPANNQVLQVLSVFGSDVRLQWATLGVGSGNVTVTNPPANQPIGWLPRWNGTGNLLEQSAIQDRTYPAGPGGIPAAGNGTVEIDCLQLMFKRLNDGQDMSDFYMRSYAGYNAALRYEHRAWTGGPPNPGVEDSINTDGELQVALGSVSAGAVPAAVLGSHHSWFKGGVRIKPTSANFSAVNSALEVYAYNDSGNANALFAVTQAGDLSRIKGVNYQWPSPLFTTAPPRFLQCTYFGSAPGTGLLAWVELPTTGGITGTGTANTIVEWNVGGSTLKDSPLFDDLTAGGVSFSKRLIGVGEGTINLGDVQNHRFGGLYVINGVFIETAATSNQAASTRSSPRSFGFFPQYSTAGGDESGQIFLYGTRNLLQSGFAIRTTMGTYYGIELRGTRGQPAGVTPTTGAASDPCVSIISETTSVPVLVCNAINGASADLARFQAATTTVAKVTSTGGGQFDSLQTPLVTTGIYVTAGNFGLNVNSGSDSALIRPTYLAVQSSVDSIKFMPGHVGSSTGVLYVAVNGASNVQIPFGNGTNAGDYFTWSTGALKWIISPAPTGSGGVTGTGTMTSGALTRWSTAGANGTITDSGISDSGTILTFNRWMLMGADGTLNIGDSPTGPQNHCRVGAIYAKNGLFLYSAAGAGAPLTSFFHGGIKNSVALIQPPAGTFTVNLSAYLGYHTLLLDTVNNAFNIQLPALDANLEGQRWRIIVIRRTLNRNINLIPSGSDQINESGVGIGWTLNGSTANTRDGTLVAVYQGGSLTQWYFAYTPT